MALQMADDFVQRNGLSSELVSMGFQPQYVERALDVHLRSKYGNNWNMSLLVEIIERLKSKDVEEIAQQQNQLAFVPHFESMDQALCLQVNECVDYRFESGRVILCQIVAVNRQLKTHLLTLHPAGRPLSDTKYDKYCNVYTEYMKLGVAKSVSLRCMNRTHPFATMQELDYIDVNPAAHAGDNTWKNAKIIKLDKSSSQGKVLYHHWREQRNYAYWVHLENAFEVAPFRSKCNVLSEQQILARLEAAPVAEVSISMNHAGAAGHAKQLQRMSMSNMSNMSSMNGLNHRPASRNASVSVSHSRKKMHQYRSSQSSMASNSKASSMSQSQSQFLSLHSRHTTSPSALSECTVYSVPESDSQIDRINNHAGMHHQKDHKYRAYAHAPPMQPALQFSHSFDGAHGMKAARPIPSVKHDLSQQNAHRKTISFAMDHKHAHQNSQQQWKHPKRRASAGMSNIPRQKPAVFMPPPPFFQALEEKNDAAAAAAKNAGNDDVDGNEVVPRKLTTEFNHQIQSVALGNDLLMDDIVNDIESGNRNMPLRETPMGDDIDDDIDDAHSVRESQYKASPMRLQVSSSVEVEDRVVLAVHNDRVDDDDDDDDSASSDSDPLLCIPSPVSQKDKTEIRVQSALQTLTRFGYEKTDILSAMDKVSDKSNIDDLLRSIAEQSRQSVQSASSVPFRLRHLQRADTKELLRKPATDKDAPAEEFDVDDIAFDDDNSDDDNEVVLQMTPEYSTPMDSNDHATDEQEKETAIDIDFYTKVPPTERLPLDTADEFKYPFVPRMSMDDISDLQELDNVDHRNPFGQFCRAKVITKDEQNNRVRLMYVGHNQQYRSLWNGWCEITPHTQYMFANSCSISRRAAHNWRLKFTQVGSLVEIRPSAQTWHPLNIDHAYHGWQCAQVHKLDCLSGQLQCKYSSNGNTYLIWIHADNEREITHIDNMYELQDVVCVFQQQQQRWMMAKITQVELNCISVQFLQDESTETLHVVFDQKRLLFPTLLRDISCVQKAIRKENLRWDLVTVTPTNDTLFQCFAYMFYGDLNLAIGVKLECVKRLAENEISDDEKCLEMLCELYQVRVRVFEYNAKSKALDIVFEAGAYDINIPIVLLSKHLRKYYNLIIDHESLDRIPFFTS